MSSIRTAFLFSSVSQYLNKILGFGFIVIIARMLTPDELGLYAIATAVVIVATEFRLMGATNYLVRAETIDIQTIRSGLGLTFCICWGMALCVFLVSSQIASFYELEPLSLLFKILSIPFLFAPFISISACILTREMKFKKIMFISLSSLSLKIVVSLTLIWMGYSYYGLAWGLVIATMFEFVLYFFVRSDVVSWKPSFRGFKPIISFGIYNTLINVLYRFENSAPDIILGKAGTVRDVALFSRGAGFLTFVNEMITAGVWQVALPAMSKIKRDGGDVNEGYIKASLLLGGLVLPVLAVAAVSAYPVILLIFGEQWVESVPIAQVIVGWVMLKSVHTLSTPLLISTENEKAAVIKQLIVFSACVVAGIIAAPYGMYYMAWAMVFAGFVDLVIGSYVLYHCLGINPWMFLRSILSNVLIAFFCVIVAFILDFILDFKTVEPLAAFVCLALIMPPTWFCCVFLVKHPLSDEVVGVINFFKKRVKSNDR
jgi:O-antigen/teichoic acid export membrane protein